MSTTIISVLLTVTLFAQTALACGQHPKSTPHSEWVWMQEQAQSGVVNTKMSDSFFSPRTKEETNQTGRPEAERPRGQ